MLFIFHDQAIRTNVILIGYSVMSANLNYFD